MIPKIHQTSIQKKNDVLRVHRRHDSNPTTIIHYEVERSVFMFLPDSVWMHDLLPYLDVASRLALQPTCRHLHFLVETSFGSPTSKFKTFLQWTEKRRHDNQRFVHAVVSRTHHLHFHDPRWMGRFYVRIQDAFTGQTFTTKLWRNSLGFDTLHVDDCIRQTMTTSSWHDHDDDYDDRRRVFVSECVEDVQHHYDEVSSMLQKRMERVRKTNGCAQKKI